MHEFFSRFLSKKSSIFSLKYLKNWSRPPLIFAMIAIVLFGGIYACRAALRSAYSQTRSHKNAGQKQQGALAYNVSPRSRATLLSELTRAEYYQGLPVGSVKFTQAPQSWGTVVFFPQVHRMPGSSLDDKKNDHAVVVQKQTHAILKQLHTAAPDMFDLIVVEGELAGVVAAEQKEPITRALTLSDQFAAQFKKLRDAFELAPFNASTEKRVVTAGAQLLKTVERRIVLQGAPFALWAEGKALVLVGAENQRTLDESRELVRDYLYLQDRLQTVAAAKGAQKSLGMGSTFVPPTNTPAGPASAQSFLQSLARRRPSFGSDVRRIEQEAVQLNDTESATLARSVRELGTMLQRISFEGEKKTASAGAPVRKENPYASVTDAGLLQEKLRQSEEKINQVIIARRNQEAAENVAGALRSVQETVGVLQYGAGHEEGLTKALLSQGLSVLQITPEAITQK